MGERIKKLKKIRIHREGTNELTLSMLAIALIGTGLWYALDTTIPFWIFVVPCRRKNCRRRGSRGEHLFPRQAPHD